VRAAHAALVREGGKHGTKGGDSALLDECFIDWTC